MLAVTAMKVAPDKGVPEETTGQREIADALSELAKVQPRNGSERSDSKGRFCEIDAHFPDAHPQYRLETGRIICDKLRVCGMREEECVPLAKEVATWVMYLAEVSGAARSAYVILEKRKRGVSKIVWVDIKPLKLAELEEGQGMRRFILRIASAHDPLSERFPRLKEAKD